MLTVIYIATVVLINWGFTVVPSVELPIIGSYDPWVLVVGTVFIARDYAQKEVGHWVIAAMLVGCVLSYFMATPFVALASAAAFLVSETVDWVVFTISKRRLADRVLISSALSTPVDTLVFLGMIGFLSPLNFVLAVGSKMASAVLVWGVLRKRA
jgi:uncharacterized PurR-regulated membrane protein YhhQ (DUF165 family)